MLVSTAQARTKRGPRKIPISKVSFYPCPCTLSDMNFMLRGRCKESVTCGSQKGELMYGAGARNRARCENQGKRSISWTLPKRFTWPGTRRESAPWILCFEVEGSIPEKGCIFGA